jgi:hypothetical protein
MRVPLLSLTLFATSAVAVPVAATAQTESIAVEIRAGVGLDSETLGFTTGVPQGHFNLGEVTAEPVFGLGLLLPAIGPGIRPQVRVSYRPPAGVVGNWIPCDPGVVCPAIFLPVDAHANRLQATVGAEVALASPAHLVRPYASVGIGIRRYGFSWEQIGAGSDTFILESGSYGETDFVARFGLGAAVSLGEFDLTLEGEAGRSSFGPGVVATPDQPATVASSVDLGRESKTEFTMSVGLRKYLD